MRVDLSLSDWPGGGFKVGGGGNQAGSSAGPKGVIRGTYINNVVWVVWTNEALYSVTSHAIAPQMQSYGSFKKTHHFGAFLVSALERPSWAPTTLSLRSSRFYRFWAHSIRRLITDIFFSKTKIFKLLYLLDEYCFRILQCSCTGITVWNEKKIFEKHFFSWNSNQVKKLCSPLVEPSLPGRIMS